MRVTLAQVDARATVADNIALVQRVVGQHPRSLVVFPELCLNGYDLRTVGDTALRIDGPELAALADVALAARSTVVVGFAERDGDRVANSAAVLSTEGTLAGVYRKTHLFGREHAAFVAGGELNVARADGMALGPMICFDMEFPEAARTLAVRGAELLVTISANMHPFGPDHDVFVRARALETHLPHVYVNRVGAQAGLEFVGESQAVRADGTIAARLGGKEEIAEVELEAVEVDDRVDYAAQLRPELYA